jgi:hypothetical protein
MAKRAITAKNMQGSLVESLRQRDRTVLAVREVRNNMRFTDFIVHLRMDWRSVSAAVLMIPVGPSAVVLMVPVGLRTSAWRNQNPAISPELSMLVLKKERTSTDNPSMG